MALKLRGEVWYAYFSYREKQPNGKTIIKKEWISLDCKRKDTKLRNVRYGKLLEFREAGGKKDGSCDFETFKITTLARIKETQKKATYYHSRRAFALLDQYRLFKRLNQITPSVLQGFQDWLKVAGFSNVHNNRLIRVIKKEMYRAELDERIFKQNWRAVKGLPEPTNTRQGFSREEIKKMLSYNSQPKGIVLPLKMWQAFVAFGIFMGPRRDEVAKILKRDVSLERNEIYIRKHAKDTENKILEYWEPKGHEARTAPIHPQLRPHMEYLLSHEPECPYLFCHKGRPIKPDYWTSRFPQYAAAAGVERATPHRLRHTFGTLLGEKSGAGAIKALMGHKSLQTSEHYVHKGDIVSAINNIVVANVDSSIDEK